MEKVIHPTRKSVIIPPEAIAILEQKNDRTDFQNSIIQISKQSYKENDPICEDPIERAFLAAVNEKSSSYYRSKIKAGEASAISRLGSHIKNIIDVPELIAPTGFKSKEYASKNRTWNISPEVRLYVRYIMFVRDYGVGEPEWFFNTYLVKNENKGEPISSLEELKSHAQTWDNFNRGCRFPDCPIFQKFCLAVMNTIELEKKALLLDAGLEVKRKDDGFTIRGASPTLELLRAHHEEFRSIIQPQYPQRFNCNPTTFFR